MTYKYIDLKIENHVATVAMARSKHSTPLVLSLLRKSPPAFANWGLMTTFGQSFSAARPGFSVPDWI